MCGRFGFDMPGKTLEEQFGVIADGDVPPSWNIAPGQPVLAVTLFEGRRELLGFFWGLRPAWADPEGEHRGHINARSETVFDKPAFKDAAKYHRCLVPASFFYEWKKQGRERVPHAVMLPGAAPFAMAGIYAMHEALGPSLAILTYAANAAMRSIHERMPVILAPESYESWLGMHTHPEDVRSMLQPYEGKLSIHPVSARVNSPQNNDASLITRTPGQGSLPLD